MGKLVANHYREQGLTLIEVLIALAIAAIALTAVIKASSQSIRGTAYLQNKSIAMWVAQEVLTEARLGLIVLPPLTDPMRRSITMLGREWYLEAGGEETPNKRIRKISVLVFEQPADARALDQTPLVTLESYVYLQR